MTDPIDYHAMNPLTQEQFIATMKAAAWERAKGELRAVSAIEGSQPSGTTRYAVIDSEIEQFIQSFEDQGYHE